MANAQFKTQVNTYRAILDGVSFENRSKYNLDLDLAYGCFILRVTRDLECRVSGQMTQIHNSQRIEFGTTPEEFVKRVFCAVGQFEAHEFIESFQLFNKNAYFPHGIESVPVHFERGDHINSLILEPWKDIIYKRHNLRIALRFVNYWFETTIIFRILMAYGRAVNALLEYAKGGLEFLSFLVLAPFALCFELGIKIVELFKKSPKVLASSADEISNKAVQND